MNDSYRDPVALQLLDGWATRWPAWLAWMGLASPLCGGLLYLFIWLVLWLKSGSNQPPQADSKVALPRLDAAEQLRRVANGLIVLGVAMLVLWIPLTFAAVVTIPLTPAGGQFFIFLRMLAAVITTLHSLLVGTLAICSGIRLRRLAGSSLATVTVVLCMLPLSLFAIIGFPFGIWALRVLNRPETSFLLEDARQHREKEELAHRSSLRDGKSMWHDLGFILGFFMRDKTFGWFLGGLAALVYVICLVMFFSFNGQRSLIDGVSVLSFEVGQPSPWWIVKASATGHSMNFRIFCWANLFALIGAGALHLARKIELLQTGKMHSMLWHYIAWSILLAVVLGLGMFNLFAHTASIRATPIKPPVSSYSPRKNTFSQSERQLSIKTGKQRFDV